MSTEDVILAKLDTLVQFQMRACAPWIGSQWKWSYDQADTEVAFADDDYGGLITTLVLGSAGPLRLVDVTYTLGFATGGDDLLTATFPEVVAALAQRGYRDGREFDLHNIVPGATGVVLPGRIRLAELPFPLVRSLTIFQVDMTWESTVTNARASKEIHLTPRLDPPLAGRRVTPAARTKADVLSSRAGRDAKP